MKLTAYYIMYLDNKSEWRWTFHAANHEPIAVSSEGYKQKQSCRSAISIIAGSANCLVHER